MEDDFFLFEASTDGFLNQNFTSTEQESALLHQQNVGVDDNEKETEKQQQRGTTAWGTKQHELFDRGRLLRCN